MEEYNIRYDYINNIINKEILTELVAENEDIFQEIIKDTNSNTIIKKIRKFRLIKEEGKLKVKNKYSTLNLKTLINLLEKVINRGIYIYTENPVFITKIEGLIDKYSNI